MVELGSLALILVCAPGKAGKKVECNKAGLGKPILGATSLVILKYGSWNRKSFLIHYLRIPPPPFSVHNSLFRNTHGNPDCTAEEQTTEHKKWG